MEIYKKLLNIQTSIKANKSKYNSFGKYNYRNCEDILEALKPCLQKNNATLLINDEIVMLGTNYYIKATAKLIDIETGEMVESSALAKEEQNKDKKGLDAAQVTGSTSSYARKYALSGLLCLDDSKDQDTEEFKIESDHEKKEQEKQEQKQAEQERKKKIAVAKKLIKTHDINIKGILERYGLESIDGMTFEQVDKLNAMIAFSLKKKAEREQQELEKNINNVQEENLL